MKGEIENLNKICDEPKTHNYSEESKLKRNKMLLETFVITLEQPIITKKMIEFLQNKSVLECLINQIAKGKTVSSEKDLIISYKTMYIFSCGSECFEAFVEKNLETILKILFNNSFKEGTETNHYHVRELFKILYLKHSERVIEIIIKENLFINIIEEKLIISPIGKPFFK
jgi:hypothetical protein